MVITDFLDNIIKVGDTLAFATCYDRSASLSRRKVVSLVNKRKEPALIVCDIDDEGNAVGRRREINFPSRTIVIPR